MKEQGIPKGSALSLLAFLGGRTSSHSKDDGLVNKLLDQIGWKPKEKPKMSTGVKGWPQLPTLKKL
jgi:hypothetical protein